MTPHHRKGDCHCDRIVGTCSCFLQRLYPKNPRAPVRDLTGAPVDVTSANVDQDAEIFAPDKIVCEPPHDCGNCPRWETCEKYEAPDDEEEDDANGSSLEDEEVSCESKEDENEEEADEEEQACSVAPQTDEWKPAGRETHFG